MAASDRPGLRFELKCATDAGAWSKLRAALWTDRACLRRLFPERVVQSIYLDTDRGRALFENLSGQSNREKWRVRWYGDDAELVTAQLEHKVRENAMGWKEVFALSHPIAVEDMERADFRDALDERLEPHVRERLHGLVPAQWIRYTREYFTSADRRLRVTLDRDLKSYDLRVNPTIDRRTPTPLARVLVLEVKCEPEYLDRARELVGRLPVPVGRSSKFVLASAGSHGPIPSIEEL